MRRRSNASEQPVSYGSVGMTSLPDILSFPPSGFTARESTWKIGSGAERFDLARELLFQWGMQRAAGVEVSVLGDGDTSGYAGLFQDPLGGWQRSGSGDEVFVTRDDSTVIVPGMRVRASGLWRWPAISADFRVIYVVREPKRVGFAWGTMSPQPLIGEEYFGVEWREDDSVWTVARSVISVAEDSSTARAQAVRLAFIPRHKSQLARYARALSPARVGDVGRAGDGGRLADSRAVSGSMADQVREADEFVVVDAEVIDAEVIDDDE